MAAVDQDDPIIPKHDGLSVAYLCGLFNSELLDLWYAVRGKTPRDVWRNYEPKPMAEIPYRSVGTWRPASELWRSSTRPSSGTMRKTAAELVAEIGAALSKAGGRVVARPPRRLRESSARSPRTGRPFFLFARAFALERIVKDPWDTGPRHAGPLPSRSSCQPARTISSDRPRAPGHEVDLDGALGRPRLNGGALEFVLQAAGDSAGGGPAPDSTSSCEILGGIRRILPDDLLRVRLPRDLDGVRASITAEAARRRDSSRSGRTLVEAAERLVCGMFDVPSDLEDEVVAHAVQRAAGRHGRVDSD